MCLAASVYGALSECASSGRTIVGSKLSQQFELTDSINVVLDQVAEICKHKDEPNLTALVVQFNSGIPAPQFFEKYYPEIKPRNRIALYKHIKKDIFDNANRTRSGHV